QAGAQLAWIEGFADVVVGADLEADHAIDGVGRSGDHDDSDVVTLAQVPGERQPVLSGQSQVEQDDVGKRALDLGAHRRSARHCAHVVSVRAEVLAEHLAQRGVIVDDQYASGVRHVRKPSISSVLRRRPFGPPRGSSAALSSRISIAARAGATPERAAYEAATRRGEALTQPSEAVIARTSGD